MKKVRTFKDGKLKLSADGLLEQDENGKIIAGDVRNTWAGLLSLQALFVQEHNLVCDVLKVLKLLAFNEYTTIQVKMHLMDSTTVIRDQVPYCKTKTDRKNINSTNCIYEMNPSYNMCLSWIFYYSYNLC